MLRSVDFSPIIDPLRKMLEKNGVVDIICYDGLNIPAKIIRVKKTDTEDMKDRALLETIDCRSIELGKGEE